MRINRRKYAPLPALLLSAGSVVLAPSLSAGAAQSGVAYQPDLQVAEVKVQLAGQKNVIKAGKFLGNDQYTSTPPEESHFVVPRELGKQVFILKLQNDGTGDDLIRLKFYDGSGEPGYKVRLFMAEEGRNNKIQRGRPISRPATSEDGYEVVLPGTKTKAKAAESLFWLEVKLRPRYGDERTEELIFWARSTQGRGLQNIADARPFDASVSRPMDQMKLQLGETPEIPDFGDAIDPDDVIVAAPRASDPMDWPVTAEIEILAFRPGHQEWAPDPDWPHEFVLGGPAEGNLWIVRNVNGQYEASPVDWFFPDGTRQFLTTETLAGHSDHAWPGWQGPQIGEELHFFLSTPAWVGATGSNQRSNLVRVVWGQ